MVADLIFLHFNHVPQCSAVVDKHFDGYATLQYMCRGGIELSYDHQAFLLEGEWFWPAYPGPWIRFHAAPGCPWWEHRYAAFRGPLLNRWIAENLFPLHPQPAPQSRCYATRFDELLRQLERPDRWGTLRATNLLERLLIDLAEARAQPAEREAWLVQVMETITTDDGADYAQLAEQAGMALSTLRRRFRQAVGTSLHAYALQCKIARARALLSETDRPMKAIADELGYQDIYFFSRQFHQLTGVPPAAYRKSRQL